MNDPGIILLFGFGCGLFGLQLIGIFRAILRKRKGRRLGVVTLANPADAVNFQVGFRSVIIDGEKPGRVLTVTGINRERGTITVSGGGKRRS